MMIWLAIYMLCALACAAINWADYKDRKNYFDHALKEKIVQLYIVPICPVVNIFPIFSAIVDYAN